MLSNFVNMKGICTFEETMSVIYDKGAFAAPRGTPEVTSVGVKVDPFIITYFVRVTLYCIHDDFRAACDVFRVCGLYFTLFTALEKSQNAFAYVMTYLELVEFLLILSRGNS